jgi:hypothetical protein
MFQLRKINQMECEMYQYLEQGHGQEGFRRSSIQTLIPNLHSSLIFKDNPSSYHESLPTSSSSLAAQDMFQLREINQIERTMCQYLE